MAALIRCFDWSTTTLGTLDQWPTSLRTLISMMLASRFPMLIFWGPELLTLYNDAFRPSLGDDGKHPSSLGQRGEESWAESWPVIGPMIKGIMTGGDAVWFEDQNLPIYRNGRMEYAYWTYSFSPISGDTGLVNGVLVTCYETTKAIKAQQQLQLSEQRFQNLVRQATVGIIVLTGEDVRVSIVNEAYGKLIDRTYEELIDKPLFSIIPEAKAYFDPILSKVRHSGESLYLYDTPYAVQTNGTLKNGYLNIVYQPYRETDGTITGVTVLCQDVTEQVMARLQLEEVQSGLNVAVELAQLGTWSIDVVTNGLTFSDRMIEWFGYDPGAQAYNQVIPILEAGDQERVDRAVAWALHPESGGIYNEIYTVIHPTTGQKRVLHAQGKTVFDATGRAVRLNGTAQDITLQRNLQLALESEVQQRTEELAATNEELAASNEEYAAINEELEEANRLLNRSNENLQAFTYVASHDLQEPLRKIQQFGDLLRNQYGAQVGEGLPYLERMQGAANRMSTLIRDLLSYSRLGTKPSAFVVVSLSQVIEAVLGDLELRIEETGAQIEVDALPTVQGDASQLGQLFQNLVSNALKFHKPGNALPLIQIRSERVAAVDLPPRVNPRRAVGVYHRIDVTDNGIGFEQQYADRIFEVFQRLHGKNQYAGTGIGLAICQKVAANHGGAITASSLGGQGATFSVYFPS